MDSINTIDPVLGILLASAAVMLIVLAYFIGRLDERKSCTCKKE